MWVCSNCKNENSDKDKNCIFCGSSRAEQMYPDEFLEGVGRKNRGAKSIDLADMDLEPAPFSQKQKARPQVKMSETEILVAEHAAAEQASEDLWGATVVLKQPGEEGYEEQQLEIQREAEEAEQRAASAQAEMKEQPAPVSAPERRDSKPEISDAPQNSGAQEPFVRPVAPPIPPDLTLDDLKKPKNRKPLIIALAAVLAVGLILFLVFRKSGDGEDGKKTAAASTDAATQAVTTVATTQATTQEATTEVVTEAKKEGWVEEDGKTYFYKEDGTPTTGWMEASGIWYFFKNDGVMQTGWYKEDGKTFHFDERGIMNIGSSEIDGKTYFFNKKGEMQTGWKKQGEYYTYFRPDGSQVFEEWVEGYWLDKDGKQSYPYKGEFKSDEKGTWFEDESGWFARNQSYVIDGKTYTFDAKGYVVKN